jgi:hypothetical protein
VIFVIEPWKGVQAEPIRRQVPFYARKAIDDHLLLSLAVGVGLIVLANWGWSVLRAGAQAGRRRGGR